MSEKTENEFITMEDAADLMGVKARQVYYLGNSKGGFAKFRRREDVEKYMSEDFVEVS